MVEMVVVVRWCRGVLVVMEGIVMDLVLEVVEVVEAVM